MSADDDRVNGMAKALTRDLPDEHWIDVFWIARAKAALAFAAQPHAATPESAEALRAAVLEEAARVCDHLRDERMHMQVHTDALRYLSGLPDGLLLASNKLRALSAAPGAAEGGE